METVAFVVGSILIGVAVIGGGFEAKEVKIPRVGVLARLMSLGAGLAFIVLALSLYGFNHRADLMARGPTTALASGAVVDTTASAPAADATAPAPQSNEGSFASDGAQDAGNADTTAVGAEEPAFTGFSGSNVLSWTAGGTVYTGTTYMNGETGTIRISYEANGQVYQVDEDLSLREDTGQFWYKGSNPRYADTGAAFAEYESDWFLVKPASDGGWTYVNACDRGGCHELRVEPAG